MSACRKCGREGRKGFSSDRDGLYCTNFAACRKRTDPTIAHDYSGNRSGLTCWVGEGHRRGLCGRAFDDPIHEPKGSSNG